MDIDKLDQFTKAYMEAALWSSTDDDGKPLDSQYNFEDFEAQAIESIIKDCKAFQEDNAALLEQVPELNREWTTSEQNGHDFWLTRNGHGVGFWDRGYGELGDKLSEAAERFHECDLYITDDGKVGIV